MQSLWVLSSLSILLPQIFQLFMYSDYCFYILCLFIFFECSKNRVSIVRVSVYEINRIIHGILKIIFGIYTRCRQMKAKVRCSKLECQKDMHFSQRPPAGNWTCDHWIQRCRVFNLICHSWQIKYNTPSSCQSKILSSWTTYLDLNGVLRKRPVL